MAFGIEAFGNGNEAHYATLIRCIFGNPFRPVEVDPQWLTSTVTQLAQGIYDDRAFDRLPILADALQDAGCDNADVLNHCRDTGPHARGCWGKRRVTWYKGRPKDVCKARQRKPPTMPIPWIQRPR